MFPSRGAHNLTLSHHHSPKHSNDQHIISNRQRSCSDKSQPQLNAGKGRKSNKRKMKSKTNLEILVEARRPRLPSKVTTSNPTLSAPSLTSPMQHSNNKRFKHQHHQQQYYKRERKGDHTSVEALHGQVRMGGPQGFKNPRDQGRLPYALR